METRSDIEVEAVVVAFSFLIGLLAALGAFYLERRRRAAQGSTRPYTWGYFQGLSGLLVGLIVFFGTVALLFADALDQDGLLAGALLAGAWGIPGFLVIRRRRWAWVVHTVVSLNPLWWLINSWYVSKRWSELRAEADQQISRHTESRVTQVIRRWHRGKLALLWGVALAFLLILLDANPADRGFALMAWLVLMSPLILITWVWLGGHERSFS